MKKSIVTLVLVLLGTIQMFAMSTSTIRNHARFLSDRMAYELDLSPRQYDDVYEINYDFIYWSSRIMNDVVYGYGDAIDHYYDLLDDRNDDLRYVLSGAQYRRFLNCSYFYRPIYTTGKSWSFRIYTVYRNHTFFYYDAPSHFKTYTGAHSRHYLAVGSPSFYSSRHPEHAADRYNDNFRMKTHSSRQDLQRHDFGGDVRLRNDAEKNKVNNYKNPNSPNRTENKYYKDNSGNKNSPEINHRNTSSRGSSSSTTSSNRNATNTGKATTNSSPTRGGNGGSNNGGASRQPVGSRR